MGRSSLAIGAASTKAAELVTLASPTQVDHKARACSPSASSGWPNLVALRPKLRRVTPEQRYDSLVRSILASSPSARIGEGKGFGSTGQLKADGKIFCMLVRDKLVLKLPRERVDELVEAGDGERFDAGKGKPMREWLALSASSKRQWPALAGEAMAFVSGKG